MTRFALTGAAGYVAPRHMKAIRDTGNELVAALDPKDSVGIIDSYFPRAHFFTEFERFDRHIEKLRRGHEGVDYVSICSPNYLHDAHARFALRSHAHAICEKPLVLNPWNIEALADMQRETGFSIYTILQLRLVPAVQALKERVEAAPGRLYDVDLTYLTARGRWYQASWKGDVQKSGGIATNIGVHLFDILGWVFGKVTSSKVHLHGAEVAAGAVEFERARVRWFLSLDERHLPPQVVAAGKRSYRSIRIGGEEIEFSEGFSDLHTRSYEDILRGCGFGLEEARPSVELVHQIRTAQPVGLAGDYHPMCRGAAS